MSKDEALLLDNQLCFALYATTRAMSQAYEPLLARLGVTYPQYLTLLVLWETDGLSVKQLGERLYLDSGTLTPLLKRLEQAGIVARVRSEEDERVVCVWLTARGRKMKQKAADIPREMLCKSGLTLAHVVRLRAELREVLETLKQAAPKAAS